MKQLSGQSLAVWLLALGQTLTYSGIYYSFPALLPDLQAGTGWTVAQLAFGPSLSFLVMAALTPFTGKLVDHGWGGEMLTYAPLVAGLGVVGLGLAPNVWVWWAAWALIGVAQAFCLYESCFSFLTRRLGGEARGAITKVTLVAGFAGTLTFPLGDVLGRHLGGQGALIAFAGLVIVSGPINAVAVRILRRMERAGGVAVEPAPKALREAMARPAFWALSAVFAMIYLNHGILLTYVLMLFEDRGASAGMATFAAACIGPAQVLGRLVLLFQGARIGNGRAALWSFGAMVVACAALWSAGAAPVLVFAFAALQGAGAGLLSILRPLLIADILGRKGFGAISGAVAVAPILSAAAAPSVGAAMLGLGGPALVYGSCLGLAAGGLAIGLVLLRRPPN